MNLFPCELRKKPRPADSAFLFTLSGIVLAACGGGGGGVSVNGGGDGLGGRGASVDPPATVVGAGTVITGARIWVDSNGDGAADAANDILLGTTNGIGRLELPHRHRGAALLMEVGEFNGARTTDLAAGGMARLSPQLFHGLDTTDNEVVISPVTDFLYREAATENARQAVLDSIFGTTGGESRLTIADVLDAQNYIPNNKGLIADLVTHAAYFLLFAESSENIVDLNAKTKREHLTEYFAGYRASDGTRVHPELLAGDAAPEDWKSLFAVVPDILGSAPVIHEPNGGAPIRATEDDEIDLGEMFPALRLGNAETRAAAETLFGFHDPLGQNSAPPGMKGIYISRSSNPLGTGPDDPAQGMLVYIRVDNGKLHWSTRAEARAVSGSDDHPDAPRDMTFVSWDNLYRIVFLAREAGLTNQTYEFEFHVTDGEKISAPGRLRFDITPNDDAPQLEVRGSWQVISDSVIYVMSPEGELLHHDDIRRNGDIEFIDPEDQTHTFALGASGDSALFTIDTSAGTYGYGHIRLKDGAQTSANGESYSVRLNALLDGNVVQTHDMKIIQGGFMLKHDYRDLEEAGIGWYIVENLNPADPGRSESFTDSAGATHTGYDLGQVQLFNSVRTDRVISLTDNPATDNADFRIIHMPTGEYRVLYTGTGSGDADKPVPDTLTIEVTGAQAPIPEGALDRDFSAPGYSGYNYFFTLTGGEFTLSTEESGGWVGNITAGSITAPGYGTIDFDAQPLNSTFLDEGRDERLVVFVDDEGTLRITEEGRGYPHYLSQFVIARIDENRTVTLNTEAAQSVPVFTEQITVKLINTDDNDPAAASVLPAAGTGVAISPGVNVMAPSGGDIDITGVRHQGALLVGNADINGNRDGDRFILASGGEITLGDDGSGLRVSAGSIIRTGGEKVNFTAADFATQTTPRFIVLDSGNNWLGARVRMVTEAEYYNTFGNYEHYILAYIGHGWLDASNNVSDADLRRFILADGGQITIIGDRLDTTAGTLITDDGRVITYAAHTVSDFATGAHSVLVGRNDDTAGWQVGIHPASRRAPAFDEYFTIATFDHPGSSILQTSMLTYNRAVAHKTSTSPYPDENVRVFPNEAEIRAPATTNEAASFTLTDGRGESYSAAEIADDDADMGMMLQLGRVTISGDNVMISEGTLRFPDGTSIGFNATTINMADAALADGTAAVIAVSDLFKTGTGRVLYGRESDLENLDGEYYIIARIGGDGTVTRTLDVIGDSSFLATHGLAPGESHRSFFGEYGQLVAHGDGGFSYALYDDHIIADDNVVNDEFILRLNDSNGVERFVLLEVPVDLATDTSTALPINAQAISEQYDGHITVSETIDDGADLFSIGISDADGDTATYEITEAVDFLGNDARGLFRIDSETGDVRLTEGRGLDYDASIYYELTAVATSQSQLLDPADFAGYRAPQMVEQTVFLQVLEADELGGVASGIGGAALGGTAPDVI